MNQETTILIQEHLGEIALVAVQRMLLLYLEDMVQSSPKHALSFKDLEDLTQDPRYQQLQEAQCTIDGSTHFLTITDTILEQEKIPDENLLFSKGQVLNWIKFFN